MDKQNHPSVPTLLSTGSSKPLHLNKPLCTRLASATMARMQPSQGMCLLMLQSTKVVCSLKLTRGMQPGMLKTQLLVLQQLTDALFAACSKVDPTHFHSPKHETQHAQLRRCFAALVTALVEKLDILETMHDTAALGCSSSSSSGTCMAESSASHVLWDLLFHSSQAFSSWPYNWPAGSPADYAYMRKAMHCLMFILLRITRMKNGVWHALEARLTLELRHEQVTSILGLPVIYTMSMTLWPTSNILSELSSLPPEFLPLFCCLSVDQLDECRPAEKAVAESQASAAVRHQNQATAPVLQPIMTISQLLCEVVQSVINSERETSFVFLSPAMIQLFKRSLQIVGSNTSMEDRPFDKFGVMVIILNLQMNGTLLNRKAACCSQELFLQGCKGSGVNLLPIYRPHTYLSDVKLVRKLMEEKFGSPTVIEVQYKLAAVIITGWTKETSEFQPFPPPPQRVQIRGTYLAVHHAVSVSVGCMRKWRQQEQRQRVCKAGGAFSNQHVLTANVLTTGLSTLIAAVYAKTSILANVSASSSPEAGPWVPCLHPMQKTLQNFSHMPGSVVVLEACFRDARCPKDMGHMIVAMSQITVSAIQPSWVERRGSVPAYTSLAASMRKVLLSASQPLSGLTDEQQSQRFIGREEEGKCMEGLQYPALIVAHQQCIIAFHGVKVRNTCPPAPLQGPGSADRINPWIAKFVVKHNIHWLQAILLSSLVQMCRRKPNSENARALFVEGGVQPPWVKELLESLSELGDGMTELASALMEGVLLRRADKDQAAKDSILLERYALTHFHGRLLPGCCNLVCVNLSGVSEAALETQLCGGCKRARYCSVSCQKAAWLEGGHRTVCGVQGL